MNKGTLTAKYIGPSTQIFGQYVRNGDIKRLVYSKSANGLSITVFGGEPITYESSELFYHSWDMENIADRYKRTNPDLGSW